MEGCQQLVATSKSKAIAVSAATHIPSSAAVPKLPKPSTRLMDTPKPSVGQKADGYADWMARKLSDPPKAVPSKAKSFRTPETEKDENLEDDTSEKKPWKPKKPPLSLPPRYGQSSSSSGYPQ